MRVDACMGVVNQPGNKVDLAWPAAVNTGHGAAPGDTVHFHWSGSHNVLQVATFLGQDAPLGKLSDAGWQGELRSGDKQADSAFDWNLGTSPCGYRPGLYYLVDQENEAGGVVAMSLTDYDASHYAKRPCSTLADPSAYGGAYAQYANRASCTLYEINNFQTETHYDWVQPILTAQQGDLVLFRWTGNHNVVQVHDVTQDALMSGGITSGQKTNCVGGPNYSCVNGAWELGEYLIDTTNYRPGILHFSDEFAMTGTGSPTGMDAEVDLRFAVPRNTPVPPVRGSCCAIDKSKGASCRVVEIYNGNDGAQLDYNVPIGRNDLVRFRWAGKLKIYQTTPNTDGTPGTAAKAGGIAMSGSVECTPGPNMTCLQGTTDAAQLVFDVDAEVKRGNSEIKFGQSLFYFHALGENTSGFTSQDSGTILYVDGGIQYDATPCP
jgi:plastocyanin